MNHKCDKWKVAPGTSKSRQKPLCYWKLEGKKHPPENHVECFFFSVSLSTCYLLSLSKWLYLVNPAGQRSPKQKRVVSASKKHKQHLELIIYIISRGTKETSITAESSERLLQIITLHLFASRCCAPRGAGRYQYHDVESPLGDEPPSSPPMRGGGDWGVDGIIVPLQARAHRSHLHGDPSVDAVPQTDAGWWLHLIWRRSWCLVALAIWAHLQVLVHNIWDRKRIMTQNWTNSGGFTIKWRRINQTKTGP